MKFSNKIINLYKYPPFSEDFFSDSLRLDLKLKHLDSELALGYHLDAEKNLKVESVQTTVSGALRGVLFGLLEIINGKPIAVVQRINAKELDHFLRDEPGVPAFEYYSQEIYEILSICEELKARHLVDSKDDTAMLRSKFFELSFSEQIDFVEEILAEFIYPNLEFKGISFEVVDILEHKMIFAISKPLKPEQKSFLVSVFHENIPQLANLEINN